jgi:uncharacterized protein YbjQ (UPF0145 family)
MRKCRHCLHEIPDAARVCEHCGKDLITGRPVNLSRAITSIIVTTGDLRRDYDVLGPVYFQVSNKGLFGSALSELIKKHAASLAAAKSAGTVGAARMDWSFLYGEDSVGQSAFDWAFFVAVQELKVRASLIGADAIIAMRQDIDVDMEGMQFFYLQMYGTAVKFTAPAGKAE